MPSCDLKSVLSQRKMCEESPAGISDYCMVVLLQDDETPVEGQIASIEVSSTDNTYTITPYIAAGSESAGNLKGYEIDFRSQSGQCTSESNNMGAGFSVTGTGRVELAEDDFAFLARLLHNFNNYLVFFHTGQKKAVGQTATMKDEWIVIGNETGEVNFSNSGDTGAERTGDHGQTFTFNCGFQKYGLCKYYGTIDRADATE